MIKRIFVLIILSALFSCENKNAIEKKTWIYLEIGLKGAPYEDAIYGEISQKDLNLIKDNTESEKLIRLTNARYNDEKESIVKDISINSNEKGTYFYKIKTITYIEILKSDPINNKVDLQKK